MTHMAGGYEIRSESRGGHWIAWVSRAGTDGKPEGSIVLVGQTREEAEARARQWAEGKRGWGLGVGG